MPVAGIKISTPSGQRINIYKINRFTTIPVLLDMLTRKKLVLLDPATWDDKNDSAIMEVYRNRQGVEKLFALCCSYGDETIHHWKTFSDGISGCCVEFAAKELIDLLDTVGGVRHGPVEYRKIMELKAGTIAVRDIPFTKRWPYRCEAEFRIIWEGSTPNNCFEIDFDLAIIQKITVSQRMPEQVYITIRELLRGAFKDPAKRINQSTLYRNDIWIGKFKKA
jgi:hypothetical protein